MLILLMMIKMVIVKMVNTINNTVMFCQDMSMQCDGSDDGDDDDNDNDDNKDEDNVKIFTICVQFCKVCQLWFNPSSPCRGTHYKVLLFLKNQASLNVQFLNPPEY